MSEHIDPKQPRNVSGEYAVWPAAEGSDLTDTGSELRVETLFPFSEKGQIGIDDHIVETSLVPANFVLGSIDSVGMAVATYDTFDDDTGIRRIVHDRFDGDDLHESVSREYIGPVAIAKRNEYLSAAHELAVSGVPFDRARKSTDVFDLDGENVDEYRQRLEDEYRAQYPDDSLNDLRDVTDRRAHERLWEACQDRAKNNGHVPAHAVERLGEANRRYLEANYPSALREPRRVAEYVNDWSEHGCASDPREEEDQKVLRSYVNHADPAVRREASRNLSLSGNDIRQFVSDEDPLVRENVATHVAIGATNLSHLIVDQDPAVRKAALRNKRLPIEEVRKVSTLDNNADIRWEAEKILEARA